MTWQFKDATCKALGSSLKLLMVAEGDAHVCESPFLLSAWLFCISTKNPTRGWLLTLSNPTHTFFTTASRPTPGPNMVRPVADR